MTTKFKYFNLFIKCNNLINVNENQWNENDVDDLKK